jgi:Ca2+-binding EF-hand superfamily protein
MRGIAKSLVLLLVAALTCCSTPTRHWSPVAKEDLTEWHPPGLLLWRYDSDGDGKVTRRELEAGIRQDFWQADTKRKGCLDDDEVRAYNERHIRIDKSTAIPLIDWNHNGCISFDEFAAPLRSLFEQMDVGNNGYVTLKDMGLRREPNPLSGK